MKKEITITYPIGKETAAKLAVFLNAELQNNFEEYIISFDNEFGKGTIMVLPCGDGICLLSFDVNFLVDISFKVIYTEIIPIDFLFLTSGQMTFTAEDYTSLKIESYQNAIVRYKSNVAVTYVMQKQKLMNVNIIQIHPKPYLEKNCHYVELMEHEFKDIFLADDSSRFYHHFGNFNLKIADYIRQLNHCDYKGLIRALVMEGFVNLILGLQLSEYENHLQNRKLPESITKEDIVKIQKAADIVKDKIHENISVGQLAQTVQLTQTKLQFGFKFLYHKTANNYIKEIKLQTAHHHLKNTNLTISEVVYKVGYSSRSYFTKIFFERFGILPYEFKKNSN